MGEAKVCKLIETAPDQDTDQDFWARRTGRQILRYQIFQPRDPDSNPYYPKSEILKRCISALRKIIAATGPKPTEGVEPELMREVSSLLAEGEMTSSEVALLWDESENPIVNELAYFLTHDVVVIDRIAGGHRGAIPNDTEIDFHICLMPQTQAAAMDAVVSKTCREFDVQLKKL